MKLVQYAKKILANVLHSQTIKTFNYFRELMTAVIVRVSSSDSTLLVTNG